MITLREIARLAGVSTSVASRALNPLPDRNARVASTTREKVLALAEKHGYRPNRSAEFLRRGTAAAISAFVPCSANRLHADLVIGLSEAAAARGFSLNLCFGMNLRSFRNFVEQGSGMPHSGIVTTPYENAGPGIVRAMKKYQNSGGKVLVLQPRLPVGSIPSVSVDEETGGRIVAEHLLARGCDRFFTFGYYPVRIEAFTRTVTAAGKKVKNLPGDEKILKLVRRVCKDGCRVGVFAAADHFALDLYRYFSATPHRIGRDIMVVGYDDMLLMDKVSPAMTTVHQPMRELGARAIGKLVRLIYGGQEYSEKIEPRLMVRESA